MPEGRSWSFAHSIVSLKEVTRVVDQSATQRGRMQKNGEGKNGRFHPDA